MVWSRFQPPQCAAPVSSRAGTSQSAAHTRARASLWHIHSGCKIPLHIHSGTYTLAAVCVQRSERVGSAEIGIGLTGMGLLFTFLGVMMFFDSGLLAVGNVCDTQSLWALNTSDTQSL